MGGTRVGEWEWDVIERWGVVGEENMSLKGAELAKRTFHAERRRGGEGRFFRAAFVGAKVHICTGFSEADAVALERELAETNTR
jgi:hypothetical protein